MKIYLRVIVLLLCLLNYSSYGQVVINEVQSSNFSTILDEYGKNDDWIELYNNDAAPVDITGYLLSDELQQADKFIFPSYTIPAHDHVLVFASGYNKTEAGGHWETAINASSNFSTIHHRNPYSE